MLAQRIGFQRSVIEPIKTFDPMDERVAAVPPSGFARGFECDAVRKACLALPEAHDILILYETTYYSYLIGCFDSPFALQ